MLRMIVCVIVFALSLNNVFAQEKFEVLKDLKNDWRVYQQDQYVSPEDNHSAESIHLILRVREAAGSKLLLSSHKPYHVFINHKLAKTFQGRALLPVDSLFEHANSASIQLTIFQPDFNFNKFQSFLIKPKGEQTLEQILKPANGIKDFTIVAGLILTIIFVALINVHPKLTADYFSFKRILSVREVEDSQTHSRFVLSANLWFYLFSGLLVSFFFLLIFLNLPDEVQHVLNFQENGFWFLMWNWLKISVLILLLLLLKALLVFILSGLFGIKAIAGAHYFNWIRLLLITASGLSAILFIYFISRGITPGVYEGFLISMVIILSGWIIVLFLKLNNKVEHTMFHLFSYICATELVPLIITVKVLFN